MINKRLVSEMAGCILTDLDGTLVRHKGSLHAMLSGKLEVLPGTYRQLAEWEAAGHKIIIVTGRPSSYRDQTVKQLQDACIIYHQLVMDVQRGPRLLINDFKPDSYYPTAQARCVNRDAGISGLAFFEDKGEMDG